MSIIVKSVVKQNDVYIRINDLIASLYEDLDNVDSVEVKAYIRNEIKMWKVYQENIYKQHNSEF